MLTPLPGQSVQRCGSSKHNFLRSSAAYLITCSTLSKVHRGVQAHVARPPPPSPLLPTSSIAQLQLLCCANLVIRDCSL